MSGNKTQKFDHTEAAVKSTFLLAKLLDPFDVRSLTVAPVFV